MSQWPPNRFFFLGQKTLLHPLRRHINCRPVDLVQSLHLPDHTIIVAVLVLVAAVAVVVEKVTVIVTIMAPRPATILYSPPQWIVTVTHRAETDTDPNNRKLVGVVSMVRLFILSLNYTCRSESSLTHSCNQGQSEAYTYATCVCVCVQYHHVLSCCRQVLLLLLPPLLPASHPLVCSLPALPLLLTHPLLSSIILLALFFIILHQRVW